MGVTGSGYLYALAALSITFSGFSALITVLRQTSGGTLSRYDAFLMVNYFLTGFAIAVLCLLPPLLSGWTTSAALIWRLPSAIAVAIGIAVEIAALVRGRRIGGPRSPHVVAILMVSYWPAFLLLLMSASGWIEPGFGPFAASLTWVFAIAGIDYVVALSILFKVQLSN